MRQRIGAVMKWAVAMGYRPDNPAGDALGQALGRQQAVVQHMRALPHGAVADALATVRAPQALVTVKDAFEFLVLTAARSGEVRLATWDEMDLDAGVWTIPAARMKAKRDHRVPLSERALAILHDVQRLSDGTGLVFPNPRGKPLSNATLSQLIKELGIAAVPYGFRSSFRDWAAERTSMPREVVEAALAHTVQNPTEATYARCDLFECRRRLMDDWAGYLRGTYGHGLWSRSRSTRRNPRNVPYAYNVKGARHDVPESSRHRSSSGLAVTRNRLSTGERLLELWLTTQSS